MGSVSGEFETKSWDENDVERLGDELRVTKATFVQRFTGGIEANTVSDTVMSYRGDGTADYVGFLRVVGSLNGRDGTFVLQTVGSFDGKEVNGSSAVVSGSGTGQLTGLRGQGTLRAPLGPTGTYTLDYTFD
jgi:hypothetical protein